MPAAAVIPALRAYINVVAVKKPVVGFETFACGVLLYGASVLLERGPTDRRGSDTCGNVHWPKVPSLVPEATSELPHSARCARRRHCE